MSATSSPPQPIASPEAAIAALKCDDNQIRYYAAWWLGKHQVKSAYPALCEALEDEDYRTAQGGYPLRRQAARALGQLKASEAVEALVEALACEGDPQLKEAAIQALGAIADPRAVTPLVALLDRGGEQPYEALIEALASLQVWSVSERIETFLSHPSERVQCATARYLFLKTKDSHYLQRIIANLDHENPYLRWAAAFDLGAIAHVEAAQAIVEAKVANSLKLLNLKRILEAALKHSPEDPEAMASHRQKCRVLMKAIDNLLIQV
ncbi:HEAT repeat domain-containing protein [Oxynema aestuarii]|uniref:HEAT repeat domain-containing protein n=1 Tax=Oxynema aestuarii AP17 TaxID=2064643 RepID=A0A6H1TYI4_9CYAN|nr:HEAT repeat domain-containing protein [Oxynema aestuarii]QIZ70823.1 HEAT repeat domain-containing protein [Oxynema aestuarii AP17]